MTDGGRPGNDARRVGAPRRRDLPVGRTDGARPSATARRVVCVTATRGEEGSWDEERWPTATLGAVREAELMRSLEILGVTEHRWLDYSDGTCADVDHEEAVAQGPGDHRGGPTPTPC